MNMKTNPDDMRKFKAFLHPNIKAHYQTFSKNPEPTKRSGHIFKKWTKETKAELTKANLERMEVGMMINRGPSRNSKSITEIVALFVDCDDKKMTVDQLLALKVKPHAIVETSPDNFHGYWLIKDCEVAQFKLVQKALAKSLGTDPAVCDPCRVMRMPGTINWKCDKAFLSKLVHIDDSAERIAINDFINQMGLDIIAPAASSKKAETTTSADLSTVPKRVPKLSPAMYARVKKTIDSVLADDRSLWLRVGKTIHSADSTERGYNLWTDWSKKSSKFNADVQNKQWREFDVNGGLNINSLFWFVNQNRAGKNSPFDEMSIADLFAETVKHHLRYDRANKSWFYFSGVVWKEDAQAPLRIARGFIEGMSQGEADNDSVKRFRSTAGLKAIVANAELLDKLNISAQEFDRDPNLFAVENGVINIVTREHRKAKPEDYLRRQAKVKFDPDAICPHWMDFLRSGTQGDQELHAYIRRALGYTMFGHANLQHFFMVIGSGGNGKGVLMRTIKTLMGDYGQNVSPNLMTSAYSSNANAPAPALANLHGARMVICTELPTGRKLDDAFIKQYAGGDEITARQNYALAFTFKPEGKLWISTNEVPEIRAADEAMWRRIKPIPFNRKFKGDDVDENLEQKFGPEFPGILRWLLIGGQDFSKNGLLSCTAVEELEAKMRKDADSVHAWKSECCIEDADEKTQAGLAFKSYSDFMRTSRRKALNPAAFRARLMEMGFKHKKSSQCNFYVGFRLQG
jgi:putative DNA primase/helicase